MKPSIKEAIELKMYTPNYATSASATKIQKKELQQTLKKIDEDKCLSKVMQKFDIIKERIAKEEAKNKKGMPDYNFMRKENVNKKKIEFSHMQAKKNFLVKQEESLSKHQKEELNIQKTKIKAEILLNSPSRTIKHHKTVRNQTL